MMFQRKTNRNNGIQTLDKLEARSPVRRTLTGYSKKSCAQNQDRLHYAFEYDTSESTYVLPNFHQYNQAKAQKNDQLLLNPAKQQILNIDTFQIIYPNPTEVLHNPPDKPPRSNFLSHSSAPTSIADGPICGHAQTNNPKSSPFVARNGIGGVWEKNKEESWGW